MAKRKPRPNSGIGTNLPPYQAPPSPQASPVTATQAPTLNQPEANLKQSSGSGDIPPSTAAIDPAAVRELAKRLSTRLLKDGRWMGPGGVGSIRDQMMKDAMKGGMDKLSAQAWVYSELDRLYPPLGQEQPNTEPTAPPRLTPQAERVQGLGEIPEDWPELPPNASLSAEIGWVQANRLRVVEDLANGGNRIHLYKALTPAPSHAALGWLETSVRAYAKYVDVAARATSQQQDEADHVRRERLAIEEMRELLRSMRPVCPHCGGSLM